jgi:uncharacterized protein YbjT (DUF2867 family)
MRNPLSGEKLTQIGCEVFSADLREIKAITRALEGADGALVICPLKTDAADVSGDARSLIDGLAHDIDAARPMQVVAISDYGAHVPSGTGITLIFRYLEEQLSRLPVPMIFLRSAEHMQNARRYLGVVRAKGILPSLHHPLTKIFPTISALDVGLVAAELLSEPKQHSSGKRVIRVEGPRRCSSEELASVLSKLVGKPVGALAWPREQWTSALTSGGLGPSYAQLVTELQDAHNVGLIDVEPGGEVRRGTTDFEAALSNER